MKNTLNILVVLNKDRFNNAFRKKNMKYLKRFFYFYLIIFIFTCILILWYSFPGFFLILFVPFIGTTYTPYEYFKIEFLIKFVEFHLLFIFTCLFTILVFVWYGLL